MDITEIRAAASNMLDGMKFNKEKLARGCIALCDQNSRLVSALAKEQLKASELTMELAALRAKGPIPASSSDVPGFGDMFGDVFNDKKTGKNFFSNSQ